MRVDKTKRPFKPFDVSYELPKDLQDDIDDYLRYLNTTDSFSNEDCYRTYIDCDLNWALTHQLLSESEISELREYYVKGGIYGWHKDDVKKGDTFEGYTEEDIDGR